MAMSAHVGRHDPDSGPRLWRLHRLLHLATINKPEIQKLSGSTCRHCTGAGCAVYDTRFPVCRSYYCAWRTVDIFDDAGGPTSPA